MKGTKKQSALLQVAELTCGAAFVAGAFIAWRSYDLPGLFAIIAAGIGVSMLANVFGVEL